MRNLVIVLSVVFYALSLLIMLAALSVQTIKSTFEDQPEVAELSSNPVKNDYILSNQAARNSVANNLDKRIEPSEIEDSSYQANYPVLLTTLGDGVFLPGQDVISSEYSQIVRDLVSAIEKAIPEYRVLIEGHTDNILIRGSNQSNIENNLQLSYMMAEAAALILRTEGISSEFITTKGYGEANPLTSNDTAKGRAKNRRVEIWLVPFDTTPEKRE